MVAYLNMGHIRQGDKGQRQLFAFYENQPTHVLRHCGRAAEHFAEGLEYFFAMHRSLEQGNGYGALNERGRSLRALKDCVRYLGKTYADMASDKITLGEVGITERQIIQEFEGELGSNGIPRTGCDLMWLAIEYVQTFMHHLGSLDVLSFADDQAAGLHDVSWAALSLQKAAIYISVVGKVSVRPPEQEAE